MHTSIRSTLPDSLKAENLKIKSYADVPVYEPTLNGNELKYVNQCINTSWISSKGSFVTDFENSFTNFIGVESTSVSNGTVALHLALWALGIGPGDEVIVPSLTYIATANAVRYMGATPIFVDVDKDTWQIDPKCIERNITEKTRAVIVVHLLGNLCDLKSIKDICKKFDLYMVEDCAEALGSYFEGRHVGVDSHFATFSFYGNKTITTGEGGMVCSNYPLLLQEAKKIKNQGVSESIEYWHDIIGHNFRMTNVLAAIGLAQIERVHEILEIKKEINRIYKEGLQFLPVKFQSEYRKTESSYWMTGIQVDNQNIRDSLRYYLKCNGIETRPMFKPINTMPAYATNSILINTEYISGTSLMIPSGPRNYRKNTHAVINSIRNFFRKIK